MTTTTRTSLLTRFLELRPAVQRHLDVLRGAIPDALQDLTLHQYELLARLWNGPLTMGQVARATGAGDSAATALTDRLARRGFLERRHDEADRRVVRVALRPEGRAAIERYHAKVRERIGAGLQCLSDAQLAALVDVCETLAATGNR